MQRQFITAVPAYAAAEAGEEYRGLMPLIGQDMSDEYPQHVGITLVKGHFTTWVEMHRLNFRADPISNLEPRVLGATVDRYLHERWMQWIEDSMAELLDDYPKATMADLERLVRWGGVTPFKITDTTCYVCSKVGSIIPVIAPMCWPADKEDPADTRPPWEYVFPAEHLRVEVGTSHDRHYERTSVLVHKLWQEELQGGWSPYNEHGDNDTSYKEWTLDQLNDEGYDDTVVQLEENARQIITEECRDVHADIVHVPHRVRESWSSVIDSQLSAYVTRTNNQARQITFAVAEGLNLWRGVTGH